MSLEEKAEIILNEIKRYKAERLADELQIPLSDINNAFELAIDVLKEKTNDLVGADDSN